MIPHASKLPTWLSVRYQLRVGQHRDYVFFTVLLFTLAAAFLAYIARLQPITHDAFHEMALFREWWNTGVFPLNDAFAYTPTVSPAVHHEWGMGAILYLTSVSSPLGIWGLSALKFSLVAGLWLLLYRVARNNGAHPVVFACLSPIVFPLMWVGFATLRAQLFTLVAMALQLLLLQEDWRGRRRWVWIWIPLYLLWLNVHAGFVVGIAMLGLHGLERCIVSISKLIPSASAASTSCLCVGFGEFTEESAIKRSRLTPAGSTRTNESLRRFWPHALRTVFRDVWHLVALLPVIAIGLLCNPWGVDYAPYLVRAITMSRPTIAEWQPLWMTYDPWTTLAAFATAVWGLVYVAWHRRLDRLRGWLLCMLAAYMALKHIRHGSLFGVLWIATVPAWITPTPLGKYIIQLTQLGRPFILKIAMVVSLLSLGFSVWQPFWKPTLPSVSESSQMVYPTGVVDYLTKHRFAGNVMTPFQHGSYVSWRLYPDVHVSLDGRYEVAYQEAVLPAHDRFYKAEDEDWSEKLTCYATDLAIIPQDTPVRKRLSELTEANPAAWKIYYQDDSFVILGRSDLSLPTQDRRGQKLPEAYP